RPRADPRCDIVRCVVEAVREVEREPHDDHDDEQWRSHAPELSVLHNDCFEHIRRVLAGVHGLLEALVDVLPTDALERVRTRQEQTRDAVAEDPIAHVLELAYLDEDSPRVLEAFEQRDSVGELPCRAPNQERLLACLQADLADAVVDDLPSRLVDMVADVVEGAGEPIHVVAVERRHEGPVEQVDELVREPVALVFEVLYPAGEVGSPFWKAIEQLDKSLGNRDDILGRPVVEVEELTLLRYQRQAQGDGCLSRPPTRGARRLVHASRGWTRGTSAADPGPPSAARLSRRRHAGSANALSRSRSSPTTPPRQQ